MPDIAARAHAHAANAEHSGGPAPPALSSENINRLKGQWGDYQRRHGLKTTNQRELIVDVFLRCSDHVSVEELLTRVRERSAKVGYATVYRTMKLLVEASLAAPRQFGDGQTRYEVSGAETPHHDHLICVQCGLILEFEDDEIEALQDKVAQRLGSFHIVRHKLELYGLCPKARGVPGGPCPDEQARSSGAHAGHRAAHGEPSAAPDGGDSSDEDEV